MRRMTLAIVTAVAAGGLTVPVASAGTVDFSSPTPPKIKIDDSVKSRIADTDSSGFTWSEPSDYSESDGGSDSKGSTGQPKSTLDRFIDSVSGDARDTVNRVIKKIKDFVLPADGGVTSGFEMRWGEHHNGLDIGAPMGADVKTYAAGEVIDSGPASGFGNWIRILHDDGSMTVYGHMRELIAHVGDHVDAGDVIAKVGSEGFSTGPHLHFEIYPDGPDGNPVDPAPILKDKGLI